MSEEWWGGEGTLLPLNAGASRRRPTTLTRCRNEFVGNGSGAEEAKSERRVGAREGGSNSVVESQPSKLLVAGSIPVSRSTTALRSLCQSATSDRKKLISRADVAQLAEHVLGKDEVTSSILVIGSRVRSK